MLDCLRITMRFPERLLRDDLGEPMVRNKELLQRTIDYIEAHPEEWDQAEWRCGTSMCFAGHAAILAGCEWRDETGPFVLLPDMEDKKYIYGDTARVDDAARFMLGLTSNEAMVLFAANNSLVALREMVQGLIDGGSIAEYIGWNNEGDPEYDEWTGEEL
jgi:hypothetical protein